MTADSIDTDEGPTQREDVNSVMVELYPEAAVPNSAASSSHAAAAASIGDEPGPAYMRPELISGGNTPKSSNSTPWVHHAGTW
jgi:hypothetical protein